ncbi:UDP-N-acetylmuramoyl-tripeptide--D-alanyl-D-alanine ligase [Rhodovulum imhoffii]|uniref:UDP-N-acetylmuramoyl-tripeptide--D-alanyl-D-alanine ligase n=1 Tax=Rhodovulum imhoffii TaxID=365340 RepID=A0A2T5BPI6_9RHOB|nr:UDP-N-acetylmuramoyl-tripeptide--D-alanyl-D-alanine ligase [Rhodovulum imhoffii]MBK5932883.1 UDP-N-acetylmuramoyl-tripeptide--D-alanyl-D-alanine ligase [Rhodovulum imhoffii]PTN00961.1 UDP-N-acetylmuramoyl-tripeptide--D-alanyl-D-alanine ligase [Rhodovulum imhoffii]
MSILWTAAEAMAATGGQSTTAWKAQGVSIDTRSLTPGDLFVALADRRDGHDFVAEALAKGAAAALVSRRPAGVAKDAPLLIVSDVLAALTALGRAARARTAARVIGVTGSVGKTSTKEMLRAVLARQGHVHAAEASYNNHWGVPLTLARMPRDAGFAVIEIGMNHPGEIAPLSAMARPDVALVTTVAAAHLEAFEDIAAIAREKAAIFRGLEPGGIAVFHNDLDVTPILAGAARAAGARVLRFGESTGSDYRLTRVTLGDIATVVEAEAHGKAFLFKIRAVGRHFASNALGVLAVADVCGIDAAVAACDLGAWRPPAGRGARERLVLDVVDDHLIIDLIDDAFNANPASMAAALEVLAAAQPRDGLGRVTSGRRIAVLGDMLELGENEEDLHRAIADVPAFRCVDVVHCVGPRMRALYAALPARQRGQWQERAEDLAARAHVLCDAGDVVLVKGSKGSRVSVIVDAIRKLGQAVSTD